MNFYSSPKDAVLTDLSSQDPGTEKLEALLSNFSGRWRSGLALISPALASLELKSFEVKPYSRYLQEAPAQADIQIYQIEALQTICAWSLDSRFVSLVVDLMFGGSGRLSGLTAGRRHTEIERRVRGRVLDLLVTAFESACQPIYSVRFAELRQEKQLSMLRLSSPSELMLHASFGLEFNQVSMQFDFCIPNRALKAFVAGKHFAQSAANPQGHEDQPADDSPWAKDMQQRLNNAPVQAVAVLAEKKITVDELLSLSIGQVIPLSVAQEIPLKIDSTTFLKGRYGVKNGRYALQVGQFVASPPAPGATAPLAPSLPPSAAGTMTDAQTPATPASIAAPSPNTQASQEELNG